MWHKKGWILMCIVVIGLVCGAAIIMPGSAAPLRAPMGTAFTYQGFLNDDGSPANGLYDFEFELYDDEVAGGQVGSTLMLQDVTVAEGYFTVELDFGDWFDGTELWLEIRVRPGVSTGGYQQLLPRQPLTAVPYANFALEADKLDGLDSGDLYTQAEVDALLATYDARITVLEDLLASVSTENGGQDVVFTGVNVHVRDGSGDTEGAVNGLGNLIVGYNEDAIGPTATRTGSHNLIVGPEHSYASYGGFVAGYGNSVSERNASVSGGYGNIASGYYASISGGYMNEANDTYSAVSAGSLNNASGPSASVCGGENNTASNDGSSVCGGRDNTASGNYAAISGGQYNSASNNYDSVSGGMNNDANGGYASVCGGRLNEATGAYATVLGGGDMFAGGGNTAWANYSVVVGGRGNTAGNSGGTDRTIGEASAVLAGFYNEATQDFAAVCAGYYNLASGQFSSVSAGQSNTASGDYASVSGGINNTAGGTNSTVSGGANDSVSGGADWRAGGLFQDN
jgi:hypothetical protein